MSDPLFLVGVPLEPIVLILGLIVGSFLNVVIARLPSGKSIVHPRSRCPSCNTQIAAWHNIPILSWIWLRGHCASCRVPISIRYPTIELLTGLLFLAVHARFGWSSGLLMGLVLSSGLVAITFIDIDTWEIPDEISLPGVLLGASLRPWVFDVPWYSGLAGAALGAAILLIPRWAYFALRGQEAMGLGDVKLLAMIGAFVGVGGLLPVLLASSLLGVVIGGMLTLRARWSTHDEETTNEGLEDQRTPESPKTYWILAIQRGGRTRKLGPAEARSSRTHIRAAWVLGYRGPNARGLRILVGFVDDSPGWGNFEGLSFHLKGRMLWLGPMIGHREPLVNDADEVDWTPPPGAFPFGPFLSLGALTELLFGPTLRRLFFGLGL